MLRLSILLLFLSGGALSAQEVPGTYRLSYSERGHTVSVEVTITRDEAGGLGLTRRALAPDGSISSTQRASGRSEDGWVKGTFSPVPGLAGSLEATSVRSMTGRYRVLGDSVQGVWSGLGPDGAPRPHLELGRRVHPGQPPAPEPAGGLSGHVEEAIAINRERRDVYDRLSGGASRRLSNRLIVWERLTLVAGRYYDWRARVHNRRGIPIIQADFLPMLGLRDPTQPPEHRGVCTDAQRSLIQERLSAYRRAVRRQAGRGEFSEVADGTAALILQIQQWEGDWDLHFAMTKHTLESIGLLAFNGARYSEESDGGTEGLTRDLLRLHRWALTRFSLSMDLEAQRLHAQGVGFLVNDLPEIPFLELWRAQREP